MFIIPGNHAMCQRSGRTAWVWGAPRQTSPPPQFLRLHSRVGLEGTVFKDRAVCTPAAFLVQWAMTFALLLLPRFLLHTFLCVAAHVELPSFSPKRQAPFSCHLFYQRDSFQSIPVTVCFKEVHSLQQAWLNGCRLFISGCEPLLIAKHCPSAQGPQSCCLFARGASTVWRQLEKLKMGISIAARA